MNDSDTTIDTRGESVVVTTGELQTVFRRGDDVAAANQIASLHTQIERLREERDVSNRANEFLRGEEKRLRGERDEARRAAWLFLRCRPGTLAHLEAAKTYPWLDVEAAKAAGGEG